MVLTELSDKRKCTTEQLFADIAASVLARRREPLATYRLQLSRSFTFEDARRIVPYLDALGVTDVYASPCLKAGRNSDHGYDISDHNSLNPSLGTSADFDGFVEALRGHGMGLIFDIVPNHMGIADADNQWWADVLENGPSSPFAPFFDIDWHPLKAGSDLENRVLLPILGDPYGKVLENQELALSYADGAFFVSYHDRRMPVAPRCYAEILAAQLDELTESFGSDHGHVLELRSIITAISYLPLESETDPEKVDERQREKEIIKQRIAKLAAESPEVRAAIDASVQLYNGIQGQPRSFDLIDSLLDNQSYRLSFWRVAAEEINYRRFLDVNELAAIRVERPEVFAETHRLILDLVRQGKVTGLRIDHADGLWDPGNYLRELQRGAFRALAQNWLDRHVGTEGAEREQANQELVERFDLETTGDSQCQLGRPLYVVVEKILSRDEGLPASWPVDGTTGYDVANLINGLFVDQANSKAITSLYAAFTHASPSRYDDLVNSTKKIIMLVSLASEVNELGYQLKRIASKHRWYRDFTLNSLTYAIREVIAALPVYRTYLNGRDERIEQQDLVAVESAIGEARRRNPRTAAAVFDFVRTVLHQQYPEGVGDDDRAEWTNFVMRFQQTTGPVMAKGVEDTAFYVYNRLLSLNEVGGDPERFGVLPDRFHRQNVERLRTLPRSMVGGSTHDSKRGADVRARLNVLSEIPGTWREALVRWSRQNRKHKTMVYGQLAPDRNDEYLLYQTLLGAWPLEPIGMEVPPAFQERLQAYMQKAIKEAKTHTSWVNPNHAYDEAVAQFLARILRGRPDPDFLADFRRLQEVVAFYGMLNALAQTLLQLTVPGVPDIYQGSELWDFSLVDPDNRRPIDYARRIALLDDAVRPAHDLLENWRDGRVKLQLIQRVLHERRAHAGVFTTGDYRPLDASGCREANVVAFSRADRNEAFVVVVPRLAVGLTRNSPAFPLGAQTWGNTVLTIPQARSAETYRNVLTGEELATMEQAGCVALPLSEILATFPVALLRRSGER